MTIASIDPALRLIYLDATTVNAEIHPIDIYKEMRTLRASDETLRQYDLFMRADGNISKGGGKFTERYVTLLDGTRIVPYDTTHILTITGTLITDDGFEGVYAFNRSSLSPATEVDINYVPPQVEVIEVQTGAGSLHTPADVWAYATRELTAASSSSLTTAQNNQLMGIPQNPVLDTDPRLDNISASLDEQDLHDALDSYVNKDDYKSNSVDLTSVLNAIAALNDISVYDIEASTILAKQATLTIIANQIIGLNDPTAAEIRALFDENDFKDQVSATELHAYLDSYVNKDDWKGTNTTDLTPVLTAISALNDISVAEVEASAILSKQATLTTISAQISALNDPTAAEIRALFNEVDFKDQITQLELHTWMDNYTNKNDWKGDGTDVSSVISAIDALNDITVAEIEASSILAKQATLTVIAASVAAIPTTDSVADITPVLTAISNLNDVTPAEVRAAFDETEFQDNNTEAEVHAWLDSYTNKDNWKGLTAAQESKINDTNFVTNSIETKVDNAKAVIDTLPLLTDIDNSTVIAKKTDLTPVQTVIDALPTLTDIEGSTVLAKKSDVTVVENIVNTIPQLSELRDEMINIQFGGLEIISDQMIIKDKSGTTIAIFDLFDKNGNPTMLSVYKREVVS